VAFLFVLINFVVDVIYVRIDPRIRILGRGA
jgi:ABC-type dipeptide/oligopeptide/nickel transport system permease component